MEAWRPEPEDEKRRSVVSGRNLALALVLHVAVFAAFFLYSVVHGLFKDDEKIIPIDLTIVVNENLDGKEDEPPPLDDPPPPPPKPKPKPKPKPVIKKPDPPKALEQIVTNIVAKVDKKEEKKDEKKPEPKKEEPKKEEPKKPEEPKKTAKQLREERIAQMRKNAKNTTQKPVQIKVPNQPSGNGRTDKKTLSDAEIAKLLNAGYKPGKSNQLAKSEEQLALSLIKRAFESKWDTPPWTSELRPMVIKVYFAPGGRVRSYRLVSGSGDRTADQSILTAASRVGTVHGLPSSFIDAYSVEGIDIKFTVTPQ